jgi:hypothetical protein
VSEERGERERARERERENEDVDERRWADCLLSCRPGNKAAFRTGPDSGGGGGYALVSECTCSVAAVTRNI